MHRKFGLGLILAMPLLLSGTPVLGGDGISLNIVNDGTQDILVTVYDTSLGPNAVVLAHARVNGFTTIPLSVSLDANGMANVSWTAVTADANDRKCGHAERVGLADSSSVTVRADGECKASEPAVMPAALVR